MRLSFFHSSLLFLVLWSPTGYAALTLSQAYDLALNNDTRLQIARFQRDAVEARDDQATALMYPSLRMFSQYSKNQVEYESSAIEDRRYDGRRYGASVSQRVFDYGAYSQIRSAGARASGANFTLNDETQLLAARVAQAYFDVLAAEGRYRSLTDEYNALVQQALQSDALVERQLASITEQLEIAARRDLIETQQIDAENGLALARETFFAIIGERDVALSPLTTGFKPFEIAGDLDASISDVLVNNPKVRALEAEQTAARAAIDQAWGSVLPRVDVVATRQYSDVGFDNTTSPPRDTTYVGLNFNWTLVEGGAARARAREAWANYYATGERLKQQRQDVERELRAAWLGVHASAKRVKAAQRSLDSAELSLAAAIKAQELGVGKLVDVLLGRSAKTRAQLSLIAATMDNVMAWVQFHYVRGELDMSVLNSIESQL
jgi:TolC family type I secretion outer membrane protein